MLSHCGKLDLQESGALALVSRSREVNGGIRNLRWSLVSRVFQTGIDRWIARITNLNDLVHEHLAKCIA